uniref:X-box-binding protein 1 n=1 Tax=Penaeus monodon TaxID=6687 RepID=J9PVE0_PENMO|nr:X-box binding protein 1 [Penaeus monodon]
MAKTIVITLPKGLGDGARVAAPAALATASLASRQLGSLFAAGNFGSLVHIIKDEPQQGFQTPGFPLEEEEEEVLAPGEDKPPARKRQRLDHLSMEEKIMRRKLKNRVAAQTARDRKKQRMDQLEAQIDELRDLTAVLSEQNTCLAEENAALKEMLTKCTCGQGSTESNVNEALNVSCDDTHNAAVVVEEVTIPVNNPAGGSAVSQPQQKAVGMLAVLRIMVLSTLCSQWVNTAALAVLANRTLGTLPSLPASNSQVSILQTLPVKKRTAKWWGPHQQSWNPTGM